MIRNFKRPIEPLIGTAGRVRKIGFSTRVSSKNERFHGERRGARGGGQ